HLARLAVGGMERGGKLLALLVPELPVGRGDALEALSPVVILGQRPNAAVQARQMAQHIRVGPDLEDRLVGGVDQAPCPVDRRAVPPRPKRSLVGVGRDLRFGEDLADRVGVACLESRLEPADHELARPDVGQRLVAPCAAAPRPALLLTRSDSYYCLV